MRYKACRNCRAISEDKEEVCPICGSNDFTYNWEGIVAIVDPFKSQVAKILGHEKAGIYALKVY
ncbi:DNA-binding protein [Candidatus Korarchaeum cryptofilum]|jgi:DNA-directed RNA polymerase subunit E"|uniref:Transcription elongation factor Spt4 n=1 Tax=Candidatus Korarchaeum cryptofilum TaxID=498846 RepID=A0A429G3P2_9CREN|nr:transcription elongation factor subunit Spt4 [Candidatus Korarchaeum cryptofilum]RSN68447.1 DNA-binding protein [Candidatus Korarchaeum cryptofilum]